MLYSLSGETPVLSGSVSLASIHGTAVLPGPDFKVRTSDIGQVLQVAFTTTAPFRTLSLATSASFLPYIPPMSITDERKIKTPGLLIAHCNPTFARCAVCDANDTTCAQIVPEQAWALDRLPPACRSTSAQDVWATGAPGGVVLGGDDTTLNDTTASFFGTPDGAASVALSSLAAAIAIACVS